MWKDWFFVLGWCLWPLRRGGGRCDVHVKLVSCVSECQVSKLTGMALFVFFRYSYFAQQSDVM